MFLQKNPNPLNIAALSAFALFLAGCEQPQSTVYEVPKEQRPTSVTLNKNSNSRRTPDSGSMQVLPGMQAAADSAAEVSYNLPSGWDELEPTGIRKGNFKVSSDSGNAEVTILTFPGDVGGTLANINRWRGQIGLDAATPEVIDEFSKSRKVAGHNGLYVRLEGERQSILGAIVPFHGNTWFFKMIGDTPVVLTNEPAMQRFLDSVQFADHAH